MPIIIVNWSTLTLKYFDVDPDASQPGIHKFHMLMYLHELTIVLAIHLKSESIES